MSLIAEKQSILYIFYSGTDNSTIYYFYYPDTKAESAEDIPYLYKGEEKPSNFTPMYNTIKNAHNTLNIEIISIK